MKFANYDGRAVIPDGQRGIYAADANGGRFPDEPERIYPVWDDFVRWAETIDPAEGFAIDHHLLGAPPPQPRQVFAIGLNYVDHAREGGMDIPAEPAVFTKFVSSAGTPTGFRSRPADTTSRDSPWGRIFPSGYGNWPVRCRSSVSASRCRAFLRPVRGWSRSTNSPTRTTGDRLFRQRPNHAKRPHEGSDLLGSCASRGTFGVRAAASGGCHLHGYARRRGGARKPPVFLRDGDELKTWVIGIGEITSTCRNRSS
jgi:2,4-diketo-3-deoxy-L-fuconate hydrolase